MSPAWVAASLQPLCGSHAAVTPRVCPPPFSYSYNLGKGPRGSCFFWVSWASLMSPEGNISIQKQRYNAYCQCSMSICLLSRRLFFLYRMCPLLHAFLWRALPRRLWRKAKPRSPNSAESFSCCYIGSVIFPKDTRQGYLFIYVAQWKTKFFS